MKYVIFYYILLVHLYNNKITVAIRRHKFRSGHYDINNFISQLLASSKFDELAEKLAEKAANRIMHMKTDQGPVDRARDANEFHNTTESAPLNFKTKIDDENEKNGTKIKKGFSGKIDPRAVINESTLLSENLKLKYKYIKKNALEKNLKNQKEMVSKNVTNEDHKQNKTAPPADNKNSEKPISNQITTTQKHKDAMKKELIDENKSSRDDNKGDNQKKPDRNSEGKNQESSKDEKPSERIQRSDHQTIEPSLGQEETNFRVEQYSGTDNKEQEASYEDNGIKEYILSSLDEQNRNYSPSEEKTIADMEKTYQETQKHYSEESAEFDNAVVHFRGQENSAEENKVPSKSKKPYGGYDRSVGSKESAGHGSQELPPEEKKSSEIVDEDPTKPIIRREGDKTYTYVLAPEYQDYHEQMIKSRKEHPENPVDFL